MAFAAFTLCLDYTGVTDLVYCDALTFPVFLCPISSIARTNAPPAPPDALSPAFPGTLTSVVNPSDDLNEHPSSVPRRFAEFTAGRGQRCSGRGSGLSQHGHLHVGPQQAVRCAPHGFQLPHRRPAQGNMGIVPGDPGAIIVHDINGLNTLQMLNRCQRTVLNRTETEALRRSEENNLLSQPWFCDGTPTSVFNTDPGVNNIRICSTNCAGLSPLAV